MTSSASQPNQTSAPNSSSTAAPSYASAAGATKKPTPTPLTATGANPPLVVGGPASTAPAPQNGKPVSASPVNGRPNITPAIPVSTGVSGVPAVVHGNSSLNGASDSHTRKGSVTINAPSSHIANGGPVGGSKASIKFGYDNSPAIAHSTPQTSISAPIPIPGNNSHRIPSPAQSPSPIPIPSATGGRPPSSAPPPNPMTFGSFPGDSDRHLKQPPVPQNPLAMGHQQTGGHMRRDSQASAHGDMGNHGGHGPSRGGYQGQAGRGGNRNFTAPFNGQTMGYPPNNHNNHNQRYAGGPGPGAGRAQLQYPPNRNSMGPFPNSPQPPRASPAQVPAVPQLGTPNMSQAVPVPPQQPYYQQAHMYQHQMSMSPYGNTLNNYGPPMYPMQGYGGQQMGYMPPGPPAAGSSFNTPYAGNPYAQGPPVAQPMSRNSSQVSERPSSSTGHAQTPLVVQSQPHQRPSQPTPPAVVPAISRQAKPSKKIVIKTPQGEVVNLNNIKAPASPAATSHQSRTPPAVASTPTPPPKSFTPVHTRTDSTATNKQSDDKSNDKKKEFIEKVHRSVEAKDSKSKEDEAATSAAEEAKAADEAKSKKEEEQRLKEEERLAAEKMQAEDEAKAKKQAEAEAKAKSEAEAKAKAEAEAKAKAEADAQAAAAAKEAEAAKAAEPSVDDDEELERMIREMEEADAKREAEQALLTEKKKAAAEEAKKQAEANKAVLAAENDRKLREQEREMERLEEERERQRAEREAKAAAGNGESMSDLLAKKIGDLKLGDKQDGGASTPSSVADRLARLDINADSSTSTPAPKTGGSDKARTKPAALNLVVPSKPVEPPQPSAALQSLKSARWLDKKELYDSKLYPSGYSSPNPALNSAVTRKNKSFKYDAQFLLQFQKVFTEEPSMEFHQQIKSLIGDPDGGSRSASTRSAGPGTGRSGSKAGPTGGFPSMGQFGSNPLPLGSKTTSAERFAKSQGQIQRPAMGNPMASFGGRGGGFPGSQGMSRTPSSTNAGGIPNSPRQGSRRGGGGSRRDGFGGGGQGANKNMPLTQGQDVKPITVSASGWKPTSIGNKAAQAPIAVLAQQGHLDPEMVQRKVKAALNKMTPEKFDKISDQILAIAGQSKNEQDGRTLRQVIQLTFEKATDEAHWASMYAKFCKRMLEMMSSEIRDESILDKNGNVVSGGALFRKYLLNRCQEEFERGWKVDLPEQPTTEGDDKKAAEAALLSDEYYIAAAAKRRGLGLVQFIGELFKLGMLTERIMHECVRKLLEFQGVPDEAEIESLTKLLRTIGANLDSLEKGRVMMDAYFQRIQTIIDLPDLPSRLKFMLMDIVDLRRAQWVSKEANKGPKTLKEIQAEAEAAAAQKAADNARSNQRGPQGGRPQAGRGDARNFSQYNQALQNQIGSDDLRRLKGSATRTPSTNASFGPTSMFNSRSNSGRRLVPGGGFGRPGEDSGASSRTGTPPTRDSVAHTNAFGLLADSADHPASPPSTNASPALTKASLASEEKKEA